MAEKRTAAIYARVSTDRQAVDMQVQELKEYIKRRKWKLGPGFTGPGGSPRAYGFQHLKNISSILRAH